MKTKLLLIGTCLVFALSTRAYDFSLGGIYYNIASSKTAYVTYSMLTSIGSYSGSIEIPESVTYNGTTYSVDSIGSKAFSSCINLTSVTIPSNNQSLGYQSFYGCSSLTSITLPTSLITIGESALQNCSLLTTITIPNSVKTIGSAAFGYCSELKSITIPNSVTDIGTAAFIYCTKLTSISIPNSITSISSSTFMYSGLTSIVIPSSVNKIGQNAFLMCGLQSIHANRLQPIDLSSNTSLFVYVNTSTCILYVPKGSKLAYQNAVVWKEFTNIVEEDVPNAIETVQANELGIMIENDKLIFVNSPDKDAILVTNVEGKTIYHQSVHTNNLTIFLPIKGMYIVKVGNKCSKIMNL